MGKIISLLNITPDGFVDAQYTTPDADFYDFNHSLLAHTKTVAFGRSTFQLFQNLWPARLAESATEAQRKMANVLTEIPKEVYSSTLTGTTWQHSTILQKIETEHFLSYKQENQGGLLLFGSPSLVASLTQLHLIDEYYFCVQPYLAGKGSVRLFDKLHLETRAPLEFVGSYSLKSGVVILHYRSA